ncbi:MAG: hypothetical protein HS116_14750 [Planctomycetes bacterium]|nr:hypothetical protein [Planctomycetota bacterium]
MPTLRDKAVRHLARHTEEILSKQDEHGVFWPDAYYKAEFNTDYQQFAFYPLAWLYTLDHPDNPWRGNPLLLRAVEKSLRNNLAILLPDGQYQMSTHDHGPHPHANNWRSFHWLRTLELIGPHLDKQLAADCEAGLRRALNAVEKTARGQAASTEFCARHNAANHPAWYMLATYVLSKKFGLEEKADWAREQLERICAAQHPAGLWYEHDGPAVVYQHITMSALSHYHALTQAPAAREALRRSLAYYRVGTYPNGHPAEVLDGRVRYTGYVLSMPPATWALDPDGCAYLHFILDKLLEQPLGAGHQVHGGWLGLPFFTQFARDLPDSEEPAGGTALAGPGLHQLPGLPVCSIQRGPWTVWLSGFTRPAQPRGRWTLDFQTHLSVFHAERGLIFGGGGSKRQAALSLFTGGSRPLGLPCLALNGAVEKRGDAGAELRLDYPGFHASLRAEISATEVTLEAQADPLPGSPSAEPIYWQLPFLLKGPGHVRTEHDEVAELDILNELLPEHIGSYLGRVGKFRASGFSGAHAVLHVLPYNTHWRDGRYTPEKALGIVAQPLQPGVPRKLTIRAE